MLNRTEAFAHRQLNVLCGYIVLEIDKRLDPRLIPWRGQHVNNSPLPEIPIASTSADTADIFIRMIGHIGPQIVTPGECALAMGPEMHARCPAPCHQQRVTGYSRFACAVIGRNLNCFDIVAASNTDHAMAGLNAYAEFTGLAEQRRINRIAHIDDRSNGHARLGQRKHIMPTAVMRRHQRHGFTDGHAVTIGIGFCSRGQHHARRVIAFKYQGPLDGPLCEDHFARPDPPQFFSRVVADFGKMIGQPLDRTDEVIVITAESRCALQDRDVRCIGQHLNASLQPSPERRISQRATARFILLIDQNDALARSDRLKSGVNPRRPRADNQQIAMCIG